MRENMIEEKQQMTLNGDRMRNNFSDLCSPAKNSNALHCTRVNALKHEMLNGFVSIFDDEPFYNNFLKPTDLSFQIILPDVLLSINELGLFERG